MSTQENAEDTPEFDAEKPAQSDDESSKSEHSEAAESDVMSTSDTVPRSQYEQLLRRLGTLEKKITKIDERAHNRDLDSEDDQYEEDIDGPWLNHRMLRDIRFMLRSARSVRRIHRANAAQMEAARTDRERRTQTHLLTDAERGLSSAQLFLEGVKVKPIYSRWSAFDTNTSGNPKAPVEPIHVLLGDSRIEQTLVFDGMMTAVGDESDDLSDESQNAGLPERIRIPASTLTSLLSKTFKESVGVNPQGVLFLRPFKSFVYFERDLRKVRQDLQESINKRIQAGTSILPWEARPSATENGGKDISGEDPLGRPGFVNVAQRGEHDDQEHFRLLKDATAFLQLECLFDFFDTNIKPSLHGFKENDYHAEIAFDELWNLFKPGDLVLEQGERQAYRLVEVITPAHKAASPWARWFKDGDSSDSDSDSDTESDGDPLRLECVFLDYDGVQFGPVSKTFKVTRYKGKISIKSLPVYGLRFSTNPDIRQQLTQRGRMFVDVATFKPMYYTGLSLDSKEEIDSQVVVDFGEALSAVENKHWTPAISPVYTGKRKSRPPCLASCCRGKYIFGEDFVDRKLVESFMRTLMPQQTDKPPITINPRSWAEMEKDGYMPSDDELLIMTNRVFAFVLRSRKWAQLDLTHLKYDSEETRRSIESAFKRLVLPDGHKEMVQALVTQHFHGRTIAPVGGVQPDLIRGKGKGLIVLLHGAPGVGKTTTAEGVAEEFKRPLFQITCGDLGTTPVEVQTELEKNFSLASRWGCVLLLDEADVFLAQRERKDLTRNALVAIFLRILEYYTGILFLTTNRVGDFDEAFASRIHMSLHYPALNEAKTKKVFELNLDLIKDRMMRQDRHFTIDEEAILDFAEIHYKEHKYGRWNGRQIRNACQTALALAEFESDKNTVFLKPRHFKKVQEAYLEFSKYLGETFGTKGDQRAYENQLRAEESDPFTESEASIARAERNTQSSQTRLSAFRPTAQPQAAPMQPSQPTYGSYSGSQVPQEGQYFPPNQSSRAPVSQMGTVAPRQYGHQGQTWTGQPPMHQPPGQYPYQQPPQPQQPYQQQGFVVQSRDQTTDSGVDDGTNPGMRPIDF